MEGLIMDSATIQQLRIMTGLPAEGVARRLTRHEIDRYKLAQIVLSERRCQAIGSEALCGPCQSLKLDPPMCERQGDTIAIRNE